jgi:hypothetical protein
VAHPVQHDLGDGALAIVGFAARLVIDRLGQALQRPVIGCTVARRRKGLRHFRRECGDGQAITIAAARPASGALRMAVVTRFMLPD